MQNKIRLWLLACMAATALLLAAFHPASRANRQSKPEWEPGSNLVHTCDSV